jgi:hypothetical protein
MFDLDIEELTSWFEAWGNDKSMFYQDWLEPCTVCSDWACYTVLHTNLELVMLVCANTEGQFNSFIQDAVSKLSPEDQEIFEHLIELNNRSLENE